MDRTVSPHHPITETNFGYDEQDTIISGATGAIDGMHGFNSLLLNNGSFLTPYQMTVTGYCAMAGSWLTTGQPSARAWATRSLSKGSLWCAGRASRRSTGSK